MATKTPKDPKNPPSGSPAANTSPPGETLTLYDALHVLPNADAEVVQAAARVLLKKHYPIDGQPTDYFTRVVEARDTLTNPDKRESYNESLVDRVAKPGKMIGPYRILRKLTEGGFGRLYEAEHTELGIKACVKQNLQVSPEDSELFRKEAAAIAQLRHHALPAFRDFYTLPDGSCALVMSYIEGPTLEQLVDGTPKKRLEPETVAWVTERVLDALRYVHYHGIVHGDVKPQNIIVQSDVHTAVLVDYGLCSIKPNSKSRAAGYTPYFAAPEATRGQPILPESDLYSLGLTMVYALGGDIKRGTVPSSTPEPMREFVDKLLVYDVNARPHWDVVDLVQELRKVRMESFGRARTGAAQVVNDPARANTNYTDTHNRKAASA